MLELQTLLLLIPENLCADTSSFLTIFPQLTRHCKTVQLNFDASVSVTKYGSFCLSDFPLLTLNVPPTKEVAVLTDGLMQSVPSMKRSGLIILFVVVVIILAVDDLAELFGQFRTSALSILFIQKVV